MIRDGEGDYTVSQLCPVHEVSRQAYYHHLNTEVSLRYEDEIVLQWVHQIRIQLPRLGGRKLFHQLQPAIEKSGFALGRDRFFDLLRRHHLLIEQRKKYHHTTNSNHPFKRYQNLIKGLEITRRDQVFVADITYLETHEGFVYLALLTDVFSRKIVGYDVSDSLAVEGSLRALHMGLKNAHITPGSLTHHSDRGVQYCCYAYTDVLHDRQILISMGEKGNPYENAIAERVNGILKLEFLLDHVFASKVLAYQATPESIHLYNYLRPHNSIGLLTPAQKYGE